MSIRLTALFIVVLMATLVNACGNSEPPSFGEDGSPTPTVPASAGSPLPVSPTPGPVTPTSAASATPTISVDVTPVAEPFPITVDEAVNIRDRPSAGEGSTILGVLYPGYEARVVGEARSEEVEPGEGDLWYQVEMTQNGADVRGFIYAPLVKKAE